MKKIFIIAFVSLILFGCTNDSIENHVKEIEITQDNIFDYFEICEVDVLDEKGQKINNSFGYGFKSKLYGEGYVIYNFDPIYIYFESGTNKTWSKYELEGLVTMINGQIGNSDFLNTVDKLYENLVEVYPGKITVVEKSYIESYEIDSSKKYLNATIKLKNGEIIERTVNPAFLY